MDTKDKLQQIAERIKKSKDTIKTEEATKNAFIMPFINALGYDVFNPEEVVPEMDCDLTKSGDKLDYAIFVNGKPTILIECKHCNSNLDLHSTQLAKYYAASNAKFGVLTNGIEYRFYADLNKLNIMDDEPFLVVNMLDLDNDDVEQIKKFHKSYFDEDQILSTAQELKFMTLFRCVLEQEFNEPSAEFTRFLAKQVYSGQVTQNVIALFQPYVKRAIADLISDEITDRLNFALKAEDKPIATTPQEIVEEAPINEDGIVTTEEELDAFKIVRAICCREIDVEEIQYKDSKSYFAIGMKRNPSHFWICRIYIKQSVKKIEFKTAEKTLESFEFKNNNDLYNYSERIIEALKQYIQ